MYTSFIYCISAKQEKIEELCLYSCSFSYMFSPSAFKQTNVFIRLSSCVVSAETLHPAGIFIHCCYIHLR